MDTTIFSDFGIVGGCFILIVTFVLYYTPKIFNKHFEALDKMQDKFSKNLDRITDKNTEIAEGFIMKLTSITKEHEQQNNKLDAIHNDIKDIKNGK